MWPSSTARIANAGVVPKPIASGPSAPVDRLGLSPEPVYDGPSIAGETMRMHYIRRGAAPALALVLAASWISPSKAQTQSEPPVSYDGGACGGVMKVQDAKIRCNKGFRISSELYDGPSTIVLSGSTSKSTYLFRLISPRKYGLRGDDGFVSQMSIDEVETTVDSRKPVRTKSIGACTYRILRDVEGSLRCNVMTEDGDVVDVSVTGRSKEPR